MVDAEHTEFWTCAECGSQYNTEQEAEECCAEQEEEK